jgi:hypothetical protein
MDDLISFDIVCCFLEIETTQFSYFTRKYKNFPQPKKQLKIKGFKGMIKFYKTNDIISFLNTRKGFNRLMAQQFICNKL